MMAQEKSTGKITFKDLRTYLSYSLGCCGLILYLVACLASGFGQLSIGLYVAKWTNLPFEEQ
jgi:hypothetical protein